MPRPVSPRGVDQELPRLGLATCSSGPEPSVVSLAMLAGLTQWRWRVQHFRTRACPTATEAVGQVTGLPGRHLDAWLMPAVGLQRAVRAGGGLRRAVGGRGDARGPESGPGAGLIATTPASCGRSPRRWICRSSRWSPAGGATSEAFHLPRFPDGVDAVLLDEVADPDGAAAAPSPGPPDHGAAGRRCGRGHARGPRGAGVRAPRSSGARRPDRHPGPGLPQACRSAGDRRAGPPPPVPSRRRALRPSRVGAVAGSAWPTPRTRRSAATSPTRSRRWRRWAPISSSSRRCATSPCPIGSTW